MGNWLQITAWPRQGSLMLQVPDCVDCVDSGDFVVSKERFCSWVGRARARVVRGRRRVVMMVSFILAEVGVGVVG